MRRLVATDSAAGYAANFLTNLLAGLAANFAADFPAENFSNLGTDDSARRTGNSARRRDDIADASA